jgi:hypothetical protein
MKLGFPLEQKIVESYQKTGLEEEVAIIDTSKLFAQEKIRIVYCPAIYFELGSLLLPICSAFFAMRPT